MPRKKTQPPAASALLEQGMRRSTRRRREIVDHAIPDVYGDMLAEAIEEERQSSSLPSRASKRRKISKEPAEDDGAIKLDFDLFGDSRPEAPPDEPDEQPVANEPKLQQIVYDAFEDSDDSDVEFEDVDLDAGGEEIEQDDKPEQKTLQLDLSSTGLNSSRSNIRRRKPVGPAERKLRLEVHKAHLICLLAHLSCRNRWCESEAVQASLKPLVPRKLISLLHVDESKPQYQRSHSFTKAIEEICLIWRTTWTISARGMRRAQWKDEVDAVKESEDTEDLIDFDDFKSAARTHTGSRDLGAQLFCALLRSVAVDARLVCSLQVLPFSGVAKGQTPEKPKPQYFHAPSQNYNSSAFARPERPSGPPRKRIIDSPFPIWWVEVYSPATSNWIPLDPLVRNTINKPKTGFEPPASDQLNSMTYVVAFEDDNSAKDVTRRYTQWYNAKTRKVRVESTKGGQQWWDRSMAHFQKAFTEVRDEIEEADLIRRAESEGLPRNVQDFKGHPVYVLERHLRMNEVIHPRHEVGKVGAGVSKTAKLESVFRRRDVHLCRTADAWYRRGRDVKEGEQPLKRVVPKRRREAAAQLSGEFDDEGEEEAEGMALYAEYQTAFYEPPPVVDGQIPRNAYGNLDVYVPSMIPAGAAHIRHPLAANAAKVLDIDFVEAVTGFEFKGRQGTAVIDGVVVGADMCYAMVNVIEGLESQATDEADAERSRVLLNMWKRWLTALRVRDKVQREYGGTDTAENPNTPEDEKDETYQDEDHGGGFMPDASDELTPATAGEAPQPSFPSLKPLGHLLPAEIVHQQIIVVRSPNKLPQEPSPDTIAPSTGSPGIGDEDEDAGGGGFLLEDEDPPKHETRERPQSMATVNGEMDIDDASNDAGGFLPEAEDETGGGFLPDDTQSTEPQPAHTQPTTIEAPIEASPSDPLVVADAQPQPTPDTVAQHDAGAHAPETIDPQTTSPTSTPQSATSLLSHDPEEEDAEPEWLLNSLGEME